MSEIMYERLKENLEALKMKHTLEIIDNYLERAIKDELNIVDVLDHIFTEEARNKRERAYEKQIQDVHADVSSAYSLSKRAWKTLILPSNPPLINAKLTNLPPCGS